VVPLKASAKTLAKKRYMLPRIGKRKKNNLKSYLEKKKVKYIKIGICVGKGPG